MRYAIISLLTILSSCSTPTQTDTNEKIEFVKKVPKHCRFVRQQTCESIRPNGKKYCFKKIEKIAKEERISKIVIEEVNQLHNAENIGNNLMGTLQTHVDARFYKCNETSETLI